MPTQKHTVEQPVTTDERSKKTINLSNKKKQIDEKAEREKRDLPWHKRQAPPGEKRRSDQRDLGVTAGENSTI